MVLASKKQFPDIQANYRMWIHSKTRTWHDNNMQSNAPHREVLKTMLYHLASLAKWLSVQLRTKWLRIRSLLLSLKLQIWNLLQAWFFLTLRQTVECRVTLNFVRNPIKTYSQMHQADRFSQDRSIIWQVWLTCWVFVYVLSGCVFEFPCCHLNFRYGACLKKAAPSHQVN